jgi:putative acetyltransferase
VGADLPPPWLELVVPADPLALQQTEGLFRAYLQQAVFAWDPVPVEAELRALERRYASPDGALLLARRGDVALGAVALRRVDGERAEMKRLYVVPEARGLGVGRALVEGIVGRAAALGYRAVVLDTYGRTPEAISLYLSTGFVEIPAWCWNPEPDTRYFERRLGA